MRATARSNRVVDLMGCAILDSSVVLALASADVQAGAGTEIVVGDETLLRVFELTGFASDFSFAAAANVATRV